MSTPPIKCFTPTQDPPCHPKHKSLIPTRLDFNFLQPIGEGGYGTVWRVVFLKTQRTYAMKEMCKGAIMLKKSVENILNEKRILQQLSFPFISNINGAFNDRDKIYLLMDLLPGGDLRSKMAHCGRFTQQQTKFVVCCIIIAIEYIHKKKIFHRDIKPQNLVFDEKNYLRLTDFGIARLQHSKQLLDASGTPGYMAPEVLCKQIHKYEVDYYALGVLTYQLTTGKRPIVGNNRAEIRDAVLTKQHFLKKSDVPHGWDKEITDFVNRLLMRQPQSRLGSKGVKEVKMHGWLSDVDWGDLEKKKIVSPFVMGHIKYDVQSSSVVNEEYMAQYKLLQRIEKKADPFSGYMYPMKI